MQNEMMFWICAAAGAGAVLGFLAGALACCGEIRAARRRARRANLDGFAEAVRFYQERASEKGGEA